VRKLQFKLSVVLHSFSFSYPQDISKSTRSGMFVRYYDRKPTNKYRLFGPRPNPYKIASDSFTWIFFYLRARDVTSINNACNLLFFPFYFLFRWNTKENASATHDVKYTIKIVAESRNLSRRKLHIWRSAIYDKIYDRVKSLVRVSTNRAFKKESTKTIDKRFEWFYTSFFFSEIKIL